MSDSNVARPSSEQEQTYDPYRVIDVLNYGGFFGGETVTLDARPFANPDRVFSYIIPEHLFDNLTQRHLIHPGIALGLVIDGGEVRAARVLGAPTREQLKELVKPPAPEAGTAAPRALSYRCASCDLWISGMPELRDGSYYCRLCSTKLG